MSSFSIRPSALVVVKAGVGLHLCGVSMRSQMCRQKAKVNNTDVSLYIRVARAVSVALLLLLLLLLLSLSLLVFNTTFVKKSGGRFALGRRERELCRVNDVFFFLLESKTSNSLSLSIVCVLFSLKKRALFFFRFLKDSVERNTKDHLSIVCALSKEKSLSSFARKTVVERNTKDLSPLCVLFSLKKRVSSSFA